jgi:hypothetical protein
MAAITPELPGLDASGGGVTESHVPGSARRGRKRREALCLERLCLWRLRLEWLVYGRLVQVREVRGRQTAARRRTVAGGRYALAGPRPGRSSPARPPGQIPGRPVIHLPDPDAGPWLLTGPDGHVRRTSGESSRLTWTRSPGLHALPDLSRQ